MIQGPVASPITLAVVQDISRQVPQAAKGSTVEKIYRMALFLGVANLVVVSSFRVSLGAEPETITNGIGMKLALFRQESS